MQATIELSDPLFHAVEATAARQGVRLNDYISEALQDKLAKNPSSGDKPWMKFFGIAAKDPEVVYELHKIDQIVEDTFEEIEKEAWK